MISVKGLCVAVVLTCAAGCATAHDEVSVAAPTKSATTTVATVSATSPSAQNAAEVIEAAVPEIARLIAITEDNDANNMIGRVNGYVAATVLATRQSSSSGGAVFRK